MRDNIILVDCDGVLCDWEYSFTQCMNHKGYPTCCVHANTMSQKDLGLTKEVGKNRMLLSLTTQPLLPFCRL